MIASVAVIAIAGVSTPAHSGDGSSSAVPTGDQAVNAVCPISAEPIDGKTFADFKGSKVGFCCAGCVRPFGLWDDGRKEQFIAAALTAMAGGGQKTPASTQPQKEDARAGDPYTLDVCPISGGKLGSMGDPVVKVYDGREVRFCCAGCVKPFEAEKETNFAKIDKMMIKEQLPYYPLDTCVVLGGKLGSMGEPVNLVYKNRLVRFCCAGCKPQFEAEPEKYLKEIDKAIVEKQRKDYPLDKCVVMTDAGINSMGGAVETIVGNRLFRLCCAACVPKVRKDPVKYLAVLDAAWKAKGGVPAEQK